MPANTGYIHALRFSSLSALYDPVVALTLREQTFKSALLDGVALEPGQRVLDIGCGTGTLACMVAQREPGLQMHGLDGDPAILERARRKAAERGVSIRFSHGMSFQLPFPDNHFDSVLSSLFFHHLNPSSKQRTLAEILRVLKPAGHLHVADWGAAQDPLMRAAFLVIQLVDGFGTTQDNVRGKLPGMMAQAGFEGVHVDGRFRTMLGTMEIVRAKRRCWRDPGH
jgi:ubiquinone/menaquinone biosynthesis C-methylase UbiE